MQGKPQGSSNQKIEAQLPTIYFQPPFLRESLPYVFFLMLRDNAARAQQAIYMFLALGLANAGLIAANLVCWSFLAKNDFSSTGWEIANGSRSLLTVLELGVTVLTAVAFIRWMWRAYENLPAVGVQVDYSLGWTVGAWFVPVLGLFRPYNIMREIWQRTQRMAYGYVTSHSLLRVWWMLFLLRSVVGLAGAAVTGIPRTVNDMQTQLLVLAGISLFDIPALAAAIQVIRRISDFEQQLRLQVQVAELGGAAPEPLDFGATEEESYA